MTISSERGGASIRPGDSPESHQDNEAREIEAVKGQVEHISKYLKQEHLLSSEGDPASQTLELPDGKTVHGALTNEKTGLFHYLIINPPSVENQDNSPLLVINANEPKASYQLLQQHGRTIYGGGIDEETKKMPQYQDKLWETVQKVLRETEAYISDPGNARESGDDEPLSGMDTLDKF